MSKALRNYIKESKKLKKILVQTRIDEETYEQLKAVCERNGWTLTDSLRGCIDKLIDDNCEKPEKAFQLPRTINLENTSAWK